jgi:hypothetical protein
MELNPKDLARAINFASEVHLNQVDKSGQPYILHPLRLMNNVLHLGFEYAIVAICHDTIEDKWLKNIDEGLDFFSKHVCSNPSVLVALGLLTHDKKLPYMDYIIQMHRNPIAVAVKIEDLKDNSNITRLKGISDIDVARIKKYHAAYLYLTEQHNKLLKSFN